MKEIERTLIDAESIQERVHALGQEISDHYQANSPLIIIGILKGALYFLADLSRAISIPVEIELMTISSYGSTSKSSGVVRILTDLERDIENHHVLVVEDIIDTGLTMSVVVGNLEARSPASVKICTLLDKPSQRKIPVPISFCGFSIPDEFVVGYGLDLDQQYRNLPFIGTINTDITSSE